ncbi:MAG: nucleoside deaminase [Candidatus Pacebacteria bacterium]|nr:nucleoside deaminase [Candidatus Paceibacterota bacterium]
MAQPEEKFMRMAIEEAQRSREAGEYGVGAIIVRDGEVVSRSGVFLNRETDSTSHAEMRAIREACKSLNSIHLKNCVLYTTCEPCAMCAGAAIWARMQAVVYGATIADMNEQRAKDGARKAINIPATYIAEHGEPKLEVIGPFLREECLPL